LYQNAPSAKNLLFIKQGFYESALLGVYLFKVKKKKKKYFFKLKKIYNKKKKKVGNKKKEKMEH
jgi:hypothetical protein